MPASIPGCNNMAQIFNFPARVLFRPHCRADLEVASILSKPSSSETVVMESSPLPFLHLGAAGLIVAAAVYLLIRQVEVRLVLLGTGLL